LVELLLAFGNVQRLRTRYALRHHVIPEQGQAKPRPTPGAAPPLPEIAQESSGLYVC
jgi:hypothetical protein